jgi:hypothetical protein
MGLLRKKLYTAKVHYFGSVRRRDADVKDIRAWVEAPEPPALNEKRNALALLIPLSTVHALHLAKADRRLRDPLATLCGSVGKELLEGEETARGWRCGENGLASVEAAPGKLVEVPLPDQVSEPEGGSHRVWRGTLLQWRRSGALFARVRSPMQGGPLLAIAAGFELLEHAARTSPYEQTIVPAAVGLAVIDQLYGVMGSAEWDRLGRRASKFLLEAVRRFVMADDPREQLARNEKRMQSVREYEKAGYGGPGFDVGGLGGGGFDGGVGF